MKQKNLRSRIFWLIDSIKGNHLNKHLNEINTVLTNPENKTSRNIRENNLNNILQHAVNTTPYYTKYINAKSVFDFPVIKKNLIQDNFEEFRSKPFIDKKNFKVSTSGSTGVPFFLFQDKTKRDRNKADVLYFLNRCDYNIGDRLFNLAVRLKQSKTKRLMSWLQNVALIEIGKLNNEKIIEILDQVKKDRNKNKVMLGYASGFESVIDFLDNNTYDLKDINLNSIIVNSEYLSRQTKKTLSKYFNTQALSRYSSEEVGIVAHQTLDSVDSFVLNHASYFIEVLNFENDDHVKKGEIGRIVITDLFNYAMPLIRYDTGDIAKYNINEKGVTEFERIEGRKLDLIYNTQGNVLSSYIVYKKFYNYYHLLKQYQFIQQGEKEYEIMLNLRNDTFDFEKELIQDVKNDFGQDAKVLIKYVNEIPPLSSGKRRKVVNNYKT
jgi:phenylacetate-CoA ligase